MKGIQFIDGTEMTFDELTTVDCHGTPYVMMLLRKKLLNPEDVPEELLPLKDNSGASVLDVCIERFKEPIPDNKGRIVPRVFHLTKSNECKLPMHFREVTTILAIAREDGWTVAHNMALWKYLPSKMMTEEILSLVDNFKCSVAYLVVLVFNNEIYLEQIKKYKKLLTLGDGCGEFVAHVLAKRGELPIESMTEEILRFENGNMFTVLDYLWKYKHLSPEILLLPWDEKTKVFEYLLSEEFRKQYPSMEDMVYVTEQLSILAKLIQTKSLSELSKQKKYNYEEMQR